MEEKQTNQEENIYLEKNEVQAETFCGKPTAWWIVFISYTVCLFVAGLLAYQCFFVPKDVNLLLPLGDLISTLAWVNSIFGGVETSFGAIKARKARIGTMKKLPFIKRFRLFQLLIMWTIMIIISTVLKANFPHAGFDFFLQEQYFGFGTSMIIFVTSEEAVKLANQMKGKLDKQDEKKEEEMENIEEK